MRHVADAVRAARDAGVDEPGRDLAADQDRGRQARAARALHVERRRLGREARRQRRLAREIEVARVLDAPRRARRRRAAGLRAHSARRAPAARPSSCPGSRRRVRGVGAAERNPNAADDRDSTYSLSVHCTAPTAKEERKV